MGTGRTGGDSRLAVQTAGGLKKWSSRSPGSHSSGFPRLAGNGDNTNGGKAMNSRTALLVTLSACWIVAAGCSGTDPLDGDTDNDPDHAFSMGVSLSPRGHSSNSTAQDWIDHYSGHAPWGRIIAFHSNWRDDVESAGQVLLRHTPTYSIILRHRSSQAVVACRIVRRMTVPAEYFYVLDQVFEFSLI